ncbi:MAG: cytochrome c3 family protein [Hyphomicrobiaceae bacterium]
MGRTQKLWTVWALATLAGGGFLIAGMFHGGVGRANLLIGKTTSGHHQIELACNACHTKPFAGKEAMQEACVSCHGEDLKASKDSHPKKKFTDPRNADRLKKLAATECVTCHTEHRPEITHAMGVTLPTDYCALCHQKIGEERPSHKTLAFSTCADAGCHNYHDNRSIYEDFLEKHTNDKDTAEEPVIPLKARPPAVDGERTPITTASSADAPKAHQGEAAITADWLATSHAKAGVNCSGCHAAGAKGAEKVAAQWIEKPDHSACKTCHAPEVKTFTQGRHGMRLAEGLMLETKGLFGIFKDKPLTPMRPSMARLPMQAKAADKELTCTTCHAAHAFETAKAEVNACMSCHDDTHTKAYIGSPHHKLFEAEQSGAGAKGTGVSCASCHMPRETHENPETYEERLFVNHNQNGNLRPNEKMIRSVCMNCHGLGFSIDALADGKLIETNFTGRPSVRVESIQWVMNRLKEREGKAKSDEKAAE